MAIDITRDLKRYLPIFQSTHEQNLNESETSLRIGKFFEDVLGYDIFNEVSKEYTVKERFVDYAIKLDGKVAFFVEVKQGGIMLKEKHIEQASNYAANSGVSWVLLTNGRYWQMYHLTFDDGIASDLVWSADLMEDDIKDSACKLGLLHKKNVLKGELNDYLQKVKTLSPRSIVQAIFHENTLRLIRTQLKKAHGVRVDDQELANKIKAMFSKEAWETIGDVKITRRRKTTKHKSEHNQPTAPDASAEKSDTDAASAGAIGSPVSQ
jgi:predicted type IV restriction endonuclease